jgi:tetratricopeptide (TPR) repeat protein
MIMASFASVVGIGRLYAGGVEYGKSAAALSQGNYNQALNHAQSAVSLVQQDRPYQIAALASLAKLNVLVSSKPADDPSVQNDFRVFLSDAIAASGQATQLNSKSFDNWMIRASIYASVVPLRIDGAFENASLAYEEARKLNPGTPEVDYSLAQLHQARGESEDANTKARAALEKKADYTPAILLAGQIALDQGKIKDAIDSVKSALVFEPQNSIYLYQLGVLFLADKDYANSALALETALKVNAEYANAKFFLGETYAFLERNDEALVLFRDLEKQNPDNKVLKEIVVVLEGGKNPFAQGVEAPPEPKKTQ